ncbi:MAG: ABC transporter permease subunit [Candidatus Latescibacteria bacterium]|nr:ABC transporter permease subunit [Candidatus Latescibacterota bacterium]
MTSNNRHTLRRLTPYYFLLPAMLVLSLTIFYPVLSNLVMGVHKVKLLKGGGDEFIGLAHYAKLLGSRTFINSVWASVKFTIISLPLALVLGLGMALLFNEIKKYRPVFTGFLLVPWAIAPVVTGYMWRWLFHDSFGLVNHFLLSMGLSETNVPWLAQPDTAMAAVIVANIWRFMPYITIMLLAGLQGVSADLYEAAHVDGAHVLQRFWNVTLPQLRHVIGVVFLFATIWMVNDFALLFIMTEGGPAKATQVVPITIYRIGFEHLRLGRGAAASLLLLSFLLVMSIVFIRVLFADRRAAK